MKAFLYIALVALVLLFSLDDINRQTQKRRVLSSEPHSKTYIEATRELDIRYILVDGKVRRDIYWRTIPGRYIITYKNTRANTNVYYTSTEVSEEEWRKTKVKVNG